MNLAISCRFSTSTPSATRIAVPRRSAHATKLPAGYGLFPAPIVIRGRIVGSWTRELKKERVDVRVTPLARFDREQLQMISQAAERYGAFLGVKAKVIRA